VGADGAVLQLVTRCESADDFVERFARFTTESDVVVPALAHATVGTTGRFIIRLKDQSVIMAGRCEVSEVMPLASAPGAPAKSARALMRMRLVEMDAHSTGIHMRLMERRASSDKPPPEPPAPSPSPPVRPLAIVRTPPPAPRAPAPPPPPPVATPTNVTAVVRPQPVLRNPPALTLIGVAVPHRAAATTAVAAASPPLTIDTTDVSPLPRTEARVPGAAFTLPANPLSDLDAVDLASFVEFTLLETEGVDSAAIISSEAAGAPDVVLPFAAPMPTQVPASPHAPVRALHPTDGMERARRIARRAGPYAACVVVGLSVGLLLQSGKAAAPVVAAPAQVSPPEMAAPSIAPPAVASVGRECEANVTTRPAGAAVRWGDITLGLSPIAHAPIPCGSATVAITHERYADTTRTITAERGQGAMVSERLSRPPARLLVTSTPPNAVIKLNKRRVGEAPRRIGALRFEHVRVAASLPGYQPWAKTLYLREAETKLDITLTPVAKPPARRGPARAAGPAR